MTKIYDVILKRHDGCSRKNIIVFYDEDREIAIDFMEKYDKENGFTIHEKDGRFTIADILLRERTATGDEISVTPYHKIFDTVTGKRLKKAIG